MAVDAAALAKTLPVVREVRALRRIVDKGRTMRRGDISTILGGLLALVTVIGIILLAYSDKPIPAILGVVVGGAGVWFFQTSAPAVTEAQKGKGEE